MAGGGREGGEERQGMMETEGIGGRGEVGGGRRGVTGVLW